MNCCDASYYSIVVLKAPNSQERKTNIKIKKTPFIPDKNANPMRLGTHMMRAYIVYMVPFYFIAAIIDLIFLSVSTVIPNSVLDFAVWWHMDTRCGAYTFGICRGILLDRDCWVFGIRPDVHPVDDFV